MVELKPGQLVRSLAGRDKGNHYLVLEELDSSQVLLVNGRSRPVTKPKKKNKVHLQRYDRYTDLADRLKDKQLTDSQVVKILKDLVALAKDSRQEG